MSLQLIIQQETERLTERDKDYRKAEIGRMVTQNVRHWEELLRENPAEARWLLLDAYVARIDAQHEFNSVIRAERLDWARGVCGRLLAAYGYEAAASVTQASHVISRLSHAAELSSRLEALKEARHHGADSPTKPDLGDVAA